MSNQHFFTSDHHFGHKEVLEFSGRPFTNMNQMQEHLIEQWNSTVPKNGIVYHLGDFAFAGYRRKRHDWVDNILKELNGKKILFKGNHDTSIVTENERWSSVKELETITLYKQRIVLCHYPLKSWEYKYDGSWMLHGHCHGNLTVPEHELSADVGIDSSIGKSFGYAPVPLDFLMEEWFK